MKLCLITFPCYPSKDRGQGIARYSYELLFGLKKIDRSIDVSFIASRETGNPLRQMKEELTLYSKLLRSDADLYHAASPVGAKTAILARRFPLITTIHDMIPFLLTSYSKIRYNYHKICSVIAKNSTKIITTSNFTKNLIITFLKVKPEQVKVIYLGVNHNFFHPFSNKKTDSKVRRILFIGGTWHKMRGLGVLLQAFSLVSKKVNENIELLIGGEGRDTEYFRKMAHSLKIEKKTKFLGFIPEKSLPFYYNLADIFVFPSYLGFSLSLLEAMACGTPTIASDALDSPEIVGDGGILVKTDDVIQLANAMIKVITDDDYREVLRKRGLERAKKFTWEKMVRETLNLYNSQLDVKNC
jgi:glycosyltransferase involved in cell wall biosynthesis